MANSIREKALSTMMESISMQGDRGLTLAEIKNCCSIANNEDIFYILNLLQSMKFVEAREKDKDFYYCYIMQNTTTKNAIGFLSRGEL